MIVVIAVVLGGGDSGGGLIVARVQSKVPTSVSSTPCTPYSLLFHCHSSHTWN